jgi:hypothetical protein
MTTAFESESERTDLSTQELPENPTAQETKTWNKAEVLRWIQQRDPNILKGDNLEKFNKELEPSWSLMLSSIKPVACLVESV